MPIHLQTLGCRLNEAELESWAQEFQQAGHSITKNPQEARLIVLNSCAVTQEAVRKSRQSLRRLHRDNPTAKLVVSGCYATLQPGQAAEILGVDRVVPNKDKHQLVKMALEQLEGHDMPAMSTAPGEVSLFRRGRQRAFVKVQDGCRYRCSFCIVTLARGEERSRPLQTLIDEINGLHQQGIQEVILTGVHLGGYGSDINSNLVDLIEHILQNTDIPRLRLGSLEPWELSDDFFALFSNPRLMPHLHLPLQSGCDSVLKRMARRCNIRDFSQMARQARQYIADFNLTTDIIVGFPGETEYEWQQSLANIREIGFGNLHIFTYSARQGTKAARLPAQVNNETKKHRSRQLHEIARQMQQAFFERNLGKTFPVLWEGQYKTLTDSKRMIFGYTPNYLRTGYEITNHDTLENKIVPVLLLAIDKEFIFASQSGQN